MAPGTSRGGRGKGAIISGESNQSQEVSADALASSAPWKVRGVTRNLATERAFAATRTKLRVEFAHGRPSGLNRKAFVAEIGVVVRAYAPLKAENWSEIDKEDKKVLVDRLLTKFDVDMSNPVIARYVLTRMNSRYNDHRYHIKKHFNKFNVEEARLNKPQKVASKVDWDFLCTLWSSQKFVDRSAKCVESRKKILFNHRGGSKSFVQHTYEENNFQLREIPKGRIELFHDTHFSSAKGWVNSEAKIAYDNMVDLQQNYPEMSEAQICETVLGKRPGYVKGLGFGPRPDTFGSRYREHTIVENEALKSEIVRLNNLLESQNEKFQSQMEKFMAFQARTEATLDRMEGSV